MSSFTTQTTLNNQKLVNQILRILNANSLYFITISFLFVPFTFSAVAVIQFYSSSGTEVTTNFEPFNLFLLKTIIANSQNLLTLKTLITALAFTCFVILPTIVGIALITYGTHQVINRTPLTFSSTAKSLYKSFIPLLSTIIAGSLKLTFIFILFTISPIAVTEAIKALSFHFDQFGFSILTNTIVSYILALTILFFIVIWGSGVPIAVLESKSRFEPLRQSANQSTEFRWLSFYIVFLTGFLIVPALSYPSVAQIIESTAYWISILRVGATYLQSSLMILFYVVANTVLYVQYKVGSGEEIAKTSVAGEVYGKYVRVVVDAKDDEVSAELAKEEATGGFSYIIYFLFIVWVILLFCNMLLK